MSNRVNMHYPSQKGRRTAWGFRDRQGCHPHHRLRGDGISYLCLSFSVALPQPSAFRKGLQPVLQGKSQYPRLRGQCCHPESLEAEHQFFKDYSWTLKPNEISLLGMSHSCLLFFSFVFWKWEYLFNICPTIAFCRCTSCRDPGMGTGLCWKADAILRTQNLLRMQPKARWAYCISCTDTTHGNSVLLTRFSSDGSTREAFWLPQSVEAVERVHTHWGGKDLVPVCLCPPALRTLPWWLSILLNSNSTTTSFLILGVFLEEDVWWHLWV
jgi:hypothetical protein